MLPVCARAADYLVPVGTLVGLQLRTDTITVAAFDEASGSAARDAGLKIGDCITAVNGTPAQSIDQVKDLLQKCTAPVVLSVTRGSRRLTLHLTPRQTESGAVLGVYLRQGISGIGTVTWYAPETKQFAALGHGVSTGKEGLFRLVEQAGEIIPQLLHVEHGVPLAFEHIHIGVVEGVVELAQLLPGGGRPALQAAHQSGVGQQALAQHDLADVREAGGERRAVLRAVPVHDLFRRQGKIQLMGQGSQCAALPHQNGMEDAIPAGVQHRLQRVSVIGRRHHRR